MIFKNLFKPVKTISPEEVRHLIKEKGVDDYFLLDVRQPAEYEQGHIPGAHLIPLAELQANLGRITPDVMTVVYCRSGNRSRSAVGILNGAGLENAYNMAGGMLSYNGMVAVGPPEAGAFCFPEEMQPEELIAMAWYVEEGTKSFFDSIQETVAAGDMSEMFTRLMAHRVTHKGELVKLYETISGNAAGDDFPNSVLQGPPQVMMAGCVSVSEALAWAQGRSISDILDLMMSLEANMYDLYLKLGRQMASGQAKTVFEKLSREQVGHLELLGQVFERTLF